MRFKTLLFGAFVICLELQAQSTSPYLSYDWAFFELKGKVKAVKITIDDKYTETHEFSRSGVLLNEDAYGESEWDYNPYGYTRDDYGRIDGTGNCHSAWTWKGKTVVKMEYSHQGSEVTYYYLYNQSGKRTGWKDEKGRVHKYTYMSHDSHGNWTYRLDDQNGSERRKIVYYQ